jgi:hypothetical protein
MMICTPHATCAAGAPSILRERGPGFKFQNCVPSDRSNVSSLGIPPLELIFWTLGQCWSEFEKTPRNCRLNCSLLLHQVD